MTLSRLVFVSADTAGSLFEFVRSLPDPLINIVDLHGDIVQGRNSASWADHPIVSFLPKDNYLEVWERLQTPLRPWLKLLGLDGNTNLSYEPLPGLADVQRIFWLAEKLEDIRNQSTDDEELTVVVLLPPILQSLPLLRLTRTLPRLLESVWHPILVWWDQTRQRLSHLDLLLRLDLPESRSLRLSALWRQRLQSVDESIDDSEFVVCLASDLDDRQLVVRRVLSTLLNRLPLRRLWIHGRGWSKESSLQLDGLSVLYTDSASTIPAEPILGQWLSSSPPNTSLCEYLDLDDGTKLIRLYLPCLEPEMLRVSMLDTLLLVEAVSQCLELEMPEHWNGFSPCSARVLSPFLEVGFQDASAVSG